MIARFRFRFFGKFYNSQQVNGIYVRTVCHLFNQWKISSLFLFLRLGAHWLDVSMCVCIPIFPNISTTSMWARGLYDNSRRYETTTTKTSEKIKKVLLCANVRRCPVCICVLGQCNAVWTTMQEYYVIPMCVRERRMIVSTLCSRGNEILITFITEHNKWIAQ